MFLPLLAALASPASPVVVSPLRTSQLADECRGKDAHPGSDLCTGFIIGAFDTLSLTHQICPKADRASMAKVIGTARKYLRGHRDAWGSAPSFVLRDAFQAAFPCKRRGMAAVSREP